jgi:thiamine biosynthesis lipoprotein
MVASLVEAAGRRDWARITTDSPDLAIVERDVWGTSARVALWPPRRLDDVLLAVDLELERLDREASRFRSDSEISRLNRAGGGILLVSEGLAEVIGVALAAARFTRGMVDPTVGAALVALGYDRDFAAIDPDGSAAVPAGLPAPGWASMQLMGRLLRLPAGVCLDLGATAKGLGSDRSARAAFFAAGHIGGVLVSLGGDIATAGGPPKGGWPVLVADDHRSSDPSSGQMVRVQRGGLATSSVTCRAWRRGGVTLHHIVDPATGRSATGPWRTASVAAPSCAEANAASTAAIVAGSGAEAFLAEMRLPARLVARDGTVRLVGGWPADSAGTIPAPAGGARRADSVGGGR